MKIIEVTKDNFELEVSKSDKPVLVDFNANWCGPCKMLKPILESISEDRDDIVIASVDIDSEDELSEKYEVSSIPCLVLFKGGKEIERNIGFTSRDAIENMIGGN